MADVTIAFGKAEENAAVPLGVEKSKEKAAARDSDLDSSSYSDSDTSEGEEESNASIKKGPTIAKVPDPVLLLIRRIYAEWKKIFVTSCVFAVSLDPLFLYVPIINQNMNCVGLDNKLKIAIVMLRSVTDLFYIMDIIIQIYEYKSFSGLTSQFRHYSSKIQFLRYSFFPTITEMIWRTYILVDVLAILPFPQVLILVSFPMTSDSKSLNINKLVTNLFVLMQYVPRVLRIYLSCKEPKKSLGKRESTSILVKGLLNLFMYILASHVLGAVWYFFSIQRLTICWQDACRNEPGCDTNFSCYDNTVKNTTFLNDSCPISSSNTALFDFGLFLGALESGLPWSTSFTEKFSNCFCWGLQNLSSLGSNLKPSTSTWENLFVASVSIIGLLLFIYLIGNLQTYMQFDTARLEAHRHKMRMEKKTEEKDRELDLWLTKNGIPERSHKDIKPKIMEAIKQELEEYKDVDLDNILSVLSSDLEGYIRSCMPLTRLKKVKVLSNMDGRVLKAICHHLKPMKYTKNSVIIREGEPLKMLFIVEGFVVNSLSSVQQGPRELYGDKLLGWPLSTKFPREILTATESITAVGDVEALILTDMDMKSVCSKFGLHFMRKYGQLKERLLGYSAGSVKIFTEEELEKATKNYHVTRLVGEGASRMVYKGRLPDKTVVAVKRIKLYQNEPVNEIIINEIIILSQTNHKNVVRLLGCCLETREPLMVFEFMNNGTLHEHLHKKCEGRSTLSLELRMKIAAEVAGALAYLHSSPLSIIHRDVKSSNILLDMSYTAKIADFADSVFVPEDRAQLSTLVRGTLGYLDPEYFRSSVLTEKSDVFSFGVVLVELLTSQEAVDFNRPEENRNLATFFIRALKEGHLDQIVDGEIINEGNFETVQKVSNLAEICLRLSGDERPLMKKVVVELEGVMSTIAKHPAGGEKVNFFRSPKATNYLPGLPSNAYVVDVGGDDASSSSIKPYDDRR